MSIEKSIKKMEDIISQLEGGELSLEDSIALYKEGIDISLDCKNQLENAKLVINQYKNKEGDKFEK